MQKITEKLLLEKSSPKCNKLEQIYSLNLSKLGLKCQDLPAGLLSRLQSLERLDLSGNRLQEFPRNLKLPALKQLDLSDNQMEDVTSLESLSCLEELHMEDNLYVTVSDNYKLMVLLPQLRMYNGKDVSSTAKHLRYVYSDNLKTRILAVWERSFSLPEPITAEKMSTLETEFICAACQQVKFGPSSCSDFTKWRVGIMAAEYLKSLLQQKDDPHKMESTSSKDNGVRIVTPTKRKRAALPTAKLTPVKKYHVSDFPVTESPSKAGHRLKPQKVSQTDSPFKSSTPTRAQTKAETLNRAPTNIQRKEEAVSHNHGSSPAPLKETDKILPTAKSCSQTQELVCLRALHVLQCHSKQDSPDDLSTQLWACAFQPSPDFSGFGGVHSRLVATCGGDSVCVIDCETGVVMKKYKVFGEEFFTLAWTTVLMSRGQGASAQHCSILAAGGKRGTVKLIHPRNNVAYGEFRVSRKALSILRFNPNQGSLLYTGSYDNKIVLWDIGGMDSQYNYKVVQLLVLDCSGTPLHLCVPPKTPLSYLLTACEDGLHCYNTQLSNNTTAKSRLKELEITFPIYRKEDKEHDYHTVDGLCFLTDDIVASKNYRHGHIYLWFWSQTKAQRTNKKNRTVCAVVLAELQWANTQVPYLALNTCPGRSYVVCGDDRGRLWTYHISDLKAGKPVLPQILEWPTPLRNGFGKVEGTAINSVTMDPELQYLVAVTDKNMVLVWKRVV